MRIVDLRSDTVTLPTPQMRDAMYNTELGDDVYGEDPTVNRLEAMSAERLGMEAGLLTASGTMSNLLALLTHVTARGEEVIMGDLAHTFLYEVGGPAGLGSITTRTVRNQPDGTMRLDEVEASVRGPNVHHPRTRLIVVENTHNRMGGAVLPSSYLEDLRSLASRHGVKIHMDGARIFNAAVALGVDAAGLTRSVDTVCFCLSKGLACPVGSVLCGPKDFIDEARRYRKMVGGGMRQAGILAAAGIVALNEMVERLADDHDNARRLAAGLAVLPGIRLNPDAVQTNIIVFDVDPDRLKPAEFHRAMCDRGIKFNAVGGPRFRLVTHYGIEREDVDFALEAFRAIAG